MKDYPPGRAAEICNVPVEDLREAARILGTAERLFSSVLQGFYQSHQATAAAVAVQVNNLHLVRGMLGKPGCGLLQMNGQLTAQNTRECGADGDLPAFRNWDNDEHVRDLARVWNVDPNDIPHYSPPTHVMEMFRYAEEGSVRFHVGDSDQPGGVAAGAGPDPLDPGAGPAVPRRAGPLPDRDRAAR